MIGLARRDERTEQDFIEDILHGHQMEEAIFLWFESMFCSLGLKSKALPISSPGDKILPDKDVSSVPDYLLSVRGRRLKLDCMLEVKFCRDHVPAIHFKLSQLKYHKKTWDRMPSYILLLMGTRSTCPVYTIADVYTLEALCPQLCVYWGKQCYEVNVDMLPWCSWDDPAGVRKWLTKIQK